MVENENIDDIFVACRDTNLFLEPAHAWSNSFKSNKSAAILYHSNIVYWHKTLFFLVMVDEKQSLKYLQNRFHKRNFSIINFYKEFKFSLREDAEKEFHAAVDAGLKRLSKRGSKWKTWLNTVKNNDFRVNNNVSELYRVNASGNFQAWSNEYLLKEN